MASRVAEVLYRLRDVFSEPAQRILNRYSDIRNASRRTASSVESDNSRMGSTFERVAGTIGRLRNLIAGTAAVGAFVGQLRQTATALDQIGKQSLKLGVTTEELSALRYAAEQSGIPISSLDTAIQRLVRRSAEAAQGMGEARGALAELGIDAQSFVGLSLEDKMSLLADAFADIDNQSDRVRLAFKLFDTEGVAMVNVLQQGGAEMRRLTEEAREFGAVVDQQAAAAAARFNDALSRIGSSVSGRVREFYAPVIEATADLLEDMGAGGNRLDILRRQVGGLNEEIAALYDQLNAPRAGRSSDSIEARIQARIALLQEERQILRNKMLVDERAQQRAEESAEAESEGRRKAAASVEQYKESVESLSNSYESNIEAVKKALAAETSELEAARRRQEQIEQTFAERRRALTAPANEDVGLADIYRQIREAQRAAEEGNNNAAITAATGGLDLLEQLKEKGSELPAVLDFLAKQLEKVATEAAASDVDIQLGDQTKTQAQLDALQGQLQAFANAAEQLGAEAGQRFVTAMQEALQTTLQPPAVSGGASSPTLQPASTPIYRDGNNFTQFRDEIDRRGSRK